MALMPESWLNIPMETARKIGRPYFREKKGLVRRGAVLIDGSDNFVQVGAIIGIAGGAEDGLSFLHAAPFGEPARALGNEEEHHQKQRGRDRRNPQLPAPLYVAESHSANQIVREIRHQNAEDDIELEEADESSTQACGCDFGNVHGAEHRRRANAEPTDEAGNHEGVPIEGKSAANGRHQIEHCRNAQAIAASVAVTGNGRRTWRPEWCPPGQRKL